MSINKDALALLILRKKTSNRHIFKTSVKREIFVSVWKESHLVIHKVMKFLIIYCLYRKLKIMILVYSTLSQVS